MNYTFLKTIKFFILSFFLFLILQSCNKFEKVQNSDWTPLFNGKNLAGWKHIGEGEHYVEDSLIKSRGGMGLLYWQKEKLGNCRIKVVYRMRDTLDNSGVFIRIPVEPVEAWMPIHYGYEVQIDNHPEIWGEDEYHYTGTLYSLTKPRVKNGKPGPEWNTFIISLIEDKTIVEVNGDTMTVYKEGDKVPERIFDFEPIRSPRPNEGYIGLQNHDEENVVFFKEISIQKLN